MEPAKPVRKPEEQPKGRLDVLAIVPVFFRLRGKRAVLAGGTPAAAWKAELLSAAGARGDVYAQRSCDDLQALAENPVGGPVTLHARQWTPGDLVDAALAVADAEDNQEAERFRAAAKAAGVPANCID